MVKMSFKFLVTTKTYFPRKQLLLDIVGFIETVHCITSSATSPLTHSHLVSCYWQRLEVGSQAKKSNSLTSTVRCWPGQGMLSVLSYRYYWVSVKQWWKYFIYTGTLYIHIYTYISLLLLFPRLYPWLQSRV